MAGHSFVLGYGYNARGQRDRITYPALGQIDLAPDAMGRPTKLGVYADAIAYDRWGEVTSLVYGNGVTMAASRNSRGLRSHTSYALGASPLTDRSLVYDPNGNLASITDAVKGSTCAGADTLFCNGFERTGYAGTGDWAYAYDALDRLLEVSNPYAADAFSYDPLGNLRSASELGTWTYDADNRIDTRGGHSYIYDPRGNVTGDGTRSFTWNLAGELTASAGPDATTSYAYDAHGWRVKRKRAGGQAVYYVYDQSHRLMLRYDEATDTETDFLHLGTTTLARIEGGQATFILPDYHGSPLFETDANGSITRQPFYLGYGRTTAAGRSEIPGYTGAAMDENTGQTYLGARYLYHKRFTSPDPAPLNPLHPAGLNRYAYANDNPVRYTDRAGRRVDLDFSSRAAAIDAAKMAVYLAQSPTAMHEFQQIVQSKTMYTMKFSTSGGSGYSQPQHTIFIDTRGGLKTLSTGRIQSPAIGAAHEISHAAQNDRIGDAQYRVNAELDKPMVVTPGGTEPSTEEQRAVRVENQVIREVGESAYRESYNDFHQDEEIRTCSPTGTTQC